jgi:hypothetical protein
MKRKTIQYAVEAETGLIVSRVNSEVLIPILDYDKMSPENNFDTIYHLEKCSIYDTIGMDLKWTKKLPNEVKNVHRKEWGMKLLN